MCVCQCVFRQIASKFTWGFPREQADRFSKEYMFGKQGKIN